ncbi:tRNA pseudouridine synthase [Angomonas deanei]|uniref:tRNA pseudouridine synthase D (TruD), putative n=1 Tax=Angomonas deanei TaxID=59799 RepID=A0A7G2CIG4_9TRYP|nr:tRNA pseudouridine synthase [Angomonas deanei]CAD2218847.1 tRNA pseudouridine synthase D (TruD), putative [Angomonas deanei]|eukprot:EPY30214.1 tRNA pseudouridine synthase [Angomonas deanei]
MGDWVSPSSLRHLTASLSPIDRQYFKSQNISIIHKNNAHLFSIKDVLHPSFSFQRQPLPQNLIGDYYHQICEKYFLSWSTNFKNEMKKDFRDPPRPIIVFPHDVKYEFNEKNNTLCLEFSLEKGSYATVALSELLKTNFCIGIEKTIRYPLKNEKSFSELGEKNEHYYIETFQDVYEGYEDGSGFVRDVHEIEYETPLSILPKNNENNNEKNYHNEEEVKLFYPLTKDPVRRAHAWGQRNLIRNYRRREIEHENQLKNLFEKPIREEILTFQDKNKNNNYVSDHVVPIPPNVKKKRVFFQLLKRKKKEVDFAIIIIIIIIIRLVNIGKKETKFLKIIIIKNNNNNRLAPFSALNKNSWNVVR